MEYRYRKARPLTPTECRRLRLLARLSAALRAGAGARAPADDSRFERVLALLHRPRHAPDDDCVDWVLSYAPVRLLRRMAHALRIAPARPGRMKLIRQLDPDLLLPREHIVPDWQAMQVRPRASTALICLTGHALRLNMPVQLFHSLVVGAFDRVIYLRDERRERFARGVPGLGTSVAAVSTSLAAMLPAGCHVAVLATSSGGTAALEVARALGARRVMLFSPEPGPGGMDPGAGLPEATRARLYFARGYDHDRALAAPWKSGSLRDAVRWLDTDSHGTLSHLVYEDDFEGALDWLAGSERRG